MTRRADWLFVHNIQQSIIHRSQTSSSIRGLPTRTMTPLLFLIIATLANGGALAFAPPSSKSLPPRARAVSAPHRQLSLLPPLGAFDVSSLISDAASSALSGEDGGGASTSFTPTYSNASYYTTLALYVASFPGLWSQIKRSTKAKVKRKTYVR
jgi:hypothetical protein